MQDATIRFAREARTADVAMFYYSGHALQFAGVNYLVPVDANLHDETDLRRMARADEILADLQQAKNLRILVLDACRDNPFAAELKRSIGRSRSLDVGRGLAKMDSPDGTIISYATQSGRTADDGSGRNSPYTLAFLKHIEDKDSVTTVFQHVSANVYESSNGSQVPELSLSFFGEFYLNGKAEGVAASSSSATPPDPCANAADHWRSSEAIGTAPALEDHILRFPNCAFTGLAKSKLAALSKPADPVAAAASRFDGIWVIKETCEAKPPVWPAASLQYAGRIRNGIFHYQYGEEGSPGSVTYDGAIQADGTGEIAVKGLVANSVRDPLHRAPGSGFQYKMDIKLDGTRGAGVRTGTPWPCRADLAKLSPDVASRPAGAVGPSPEAEKNRPRNAAIGPDRHETEPANGMSCTKMMGRCGAVCAANTGRPDCGSTICVRLQRQCLNTGCWKGRAFSGCGLIKQ
jgi:hypothetical protein